MHASSAATACVERYGNRDEFLKTFSPDIQPVCVRHPERCLTGTAPTLATIAVAYGKDAADAWLAAQLRDLARCTGYWEKFDNEQLDILIDDIEKTAPRVKITVLALFFYNIKTGKYGEFFGNVNHLKVISWLRRFLAGCYEAYKRIYEDSIKECRRRAEERHMQEHPPIRDWQHDPRHVNPFKRLHERQKGQQDERHGENP